MKPIARKIYDPSQHTLEKKMEFMASIIFIFFSIKCKKLDVYQQNVLFHQTNTRSRTDDFFFHPASKLFHLILHSLHLSDSNKQ